ncbi:hypothetical protein ScPMuIL_003462 [Solemya velum]
MESNQTSDRSRITIKTSTGIIFVLLAVLIAVVVGLIVHFAEDRELKCFIEGTDHSRGVSAMFMKDQNSSNVENRCLEWVGENRDQICEVCSTTPLDAGIVSTTSPTSITTLDTEIVRTTRPVLPEENLRLPRALLPDQYIIEIQPNMRGDPDEFTFSGKVKITMNCTSPTRFVVLNIHRLNLTDRILFAPDGMHAGEEGPEYVGHTIDDVMQTLTVNLSTTTVVGYTYYIQMSFRGELKNGAIGFVVRSTTHNNKTEYTSLTHFEPYSARRAFPCFDEPDMKAFFHMSLVRDPDIISLSNSPLLWTEEREDGLVADQYKGIVRMSTYLVAFVFGNLQSVVRTRSDGVQVGVWARPELIDQSAEAMDVVLRSLDIYEGYFGMEYPLPKLDMVAVHDFPPQGMENWGLILYDESALLFDEEVSSQNDREYIHNVITHEIAHQWFGNIVTMRWWDDLWLNEGFATFLGILGVERLNPGKKLFNKYMIPEINLAFHFDSRVTSHPVYIPIREISGIEEAFDVISYSKGGAIVRMMRFFLGEETFFKGISSYLKSFEYQNADHNNLWHSLGNQSILDGHPIDVKATMDTWTLQMNHPVVMVTRNTTHITINQTRFLLNKNAVDPNLFTSPFNYKWRIPFVYTTNAERNFAKTRESIHWLNGDELSIQLPCTSASQTEGDWILGNIDRYGFYRVNYDRNNWQALIAQLKSDHTVLPVINRAQIVNDLWALARAGDVDLDLALGSLEYISAERELIPWQDISQQILFLNLMLSRTDLYGQYKTFWQMKLTEAYTTWEMDFLHSEAVDVSVQSLVIETACKYGVPACVKGVQDLMFTWMSNPRQNGIDPDLRMSAYCCATRVGGAVMWDFLYNQYKLSDVAAERERILHALGCAEETWILNRYLNLILDTKSVDLQDISNIIEAVCQSREGQRLSWEFMTSNWDFFAEQIEQGVVGISGILQFIVEGFNSQYELEQVEEFGRIHGSVEPARTAFQRALEQIQTNINFMSQSYSVIQQWLHQAVIRDIDRQLPRNMKPFLYNLELKPNLYYCDPANCTFDGYVKIHMTCLHPSNNITLHMEGLTIHDETVRLGTGDETSAAPYYSSYTVDEEREFLVLHLEGETLVGENYWVEMKFSGPLKNNSLSGFYLSSYRKENKSIYIATTQFQPTFARRVFPCFDEPDLKAKFKVTLVRHPPMISLSNMPIAATDTRGDGLVADIYNTTLDMSTYLLDFTVGEFHHIQATTNKGILFRVWAQPDLVNHTEEALKIGTLLLDYYEDYLNVSFPLPKQDMVAIPDLSFQAMENWGLVTYRENVLLYQENTTSLNTHQRIVVVVAHELAHMWFGDLVTMTWWDDLWLNEGFATYMMYVGGEFVYPEWRVLDQFNTDVLTVALKDDSLMTSHPIYMPVSSPDHIGQAFDSISYEKGACVVKMMINFLGEDTFKYGLKLYLEKHKYGNADHEDLWQALSEEAHRNGQDIDVGDIMQYWILQMNYPVVTVTRLANGSLSLSQKRFKMYPDSVDPNLYKSKFGYMWKIPITLTTSQNPDFKSNHIYWLNSRSRVLGEYEASSLGDRDWILGNVKLSGFFRVNYDPENWQLLKEQLHANHQVIHPINRLQIISDAFNLAISGDLDMLLALQIVEYLSKEEDYLPWDAALKELKSLDDMLSQMELYGQFQTFMKGILGPPYRRLYNKLDRSHTESLLFGKLERAACRNGVPKCVEPAKTLYSTVMSDPSVRVNAESLRAVYCTAIAAGGWSEWEFAYKQYLTTTDAARAVALLSTLSCSREPWILNKLLQSIISTKTIRRQGALGVIRRVSKNPVGHQLAWAFVASNWDFLVKEYGESDVLSKLVSKIANSITSKFELKQLEDFLQSHSNLGTAERLVKQALEKAEYNVKFVTRNYQTIRDWLSNTTSSLDHPHLHGMHRNKPVKTERIGTKTQGDTKV